MAELIFGTLFIVGWLIFLHAPAPSIAGLVPIHMAPVWYRFEIPMLLTVLLGVAAAFAHLFCPQFPALRGTLRLFKDLVGVITFYFFLGTSKFILYQGSPLHLNEPVYFGNGLVGVTTGGAYGHAVQSSLTFAYVEPSLATSSAAFQIMMMGDMREARIIPQPAWDPSNARITA